jgi:hypothetical protein
MPITDRMRTSELVLAQGMRDTRETLAEWRRDPWAAARAWVGLSAAIAALLLAAVWLVASAAPPDPSGLDFAGVTRPARPADVGRVLFGNSLVLALHALACVAGFIAGSSLPLTAARQRGLWRRIHELAGPLAICWVIAATAFSLATQAYALGRFAATLSAQLGLTPAQLLLGLLPHAVPELTALFLPLAAWTLASRRGRWHELLAATCATVAIAVPVLVGSALVEVYLSPRLVLAIAS